MLRNFSKKLVKFAAGAAVVAGSTVCVFADNTPAPNEITISGATLFKGFFQAPASTLDFIDADGDGIIGYDENRTPVVDQLAPGATFPGYSSGWNVQYFGVGSGNGLKELDYFSNASPVNPTDANFSTPAPGYANRTEFANGSGVMTGPADITHAGWAPWAVLRVDMAVMDVPTLWFLQNGLQADASPVRKPGQSGYGKYAQTSWDTTQSNKIKTLTNLTMAQIFDTQVAWVPITFIANPGTGLKDVTYTQLKYLYSTGRLPTGENLTPVTRDAGSGTRNAAMNSLGLDPSFGRGDNLGSKLLVDAGQTKPGSATATPHQVTNLDATGQVQNAVKWNRLALGYVGSDSAKADVNAGLYEALNVAKDETTINPSTGKLYFVRPTLASILTNGDIRTGYQIGGSETIATVGDPLATPINPAYPAKAGHAGNPQMINPNAAAYIRNIAESIEAFEAGPSDVANLGMPGQFLASSFVLNAAADTLPGADPYVFAPNAGQVANVKAFTLANNSKYNINATNDAMLGTIPVRQALTSPATYSDGSTLAYKDVKGATLSSLTTRNKIAGDFNNDGGRNIDDIAMMMRSIKVASDYHTLPEAGSTGNYVSLEIIGDFNGDGNFNDVDVRYFADGLAITTGTNPHLDRQAAFTAVDNAWTADGRIYGESSSAPIRPAGNFFKTTIMGLDGIAKTYNTGDSRFDVASTAGGYLGSGAYPGAFPRGANDVVDANDLAYVEAQLAMANTMFGHRSLDFTIPTEAAVMDLSCDFNSDLKVDETDKTLLQAVVSSSPAPVLQSAVSRKTHGSAGNFDIDLPLAGTGIECRIDGPTKVIMTFDKAVQKGTGFAVLLSSGTVGTTTCVGNTLEINLSGTTNKTWVAIGVSGLQGTDGSLEGTYTLAVGRLYGDVDFSKKTLSSDTVLMKTKLSPANVTTANFWYDIDCSGKVLSADVVIEKTLQNPVGLP